MKVSIFLNGNICYGMDYSNREGIRDVIDITDNDFELIKKGFHRLENVDTDEGKKWLLVEYTQKPIVEIPNEIQCPQNIQLVSLEGTIQIIREDTQDNIIGYEIMYSVGGDFMPITPMIEAGIFEYMHEGLEGGKEYQYKMRARTEYGVSEFSNIITSMPL